MVGVVVISSLVPTACETAPPRKIGAASIARLDTVEVSGQRVTASVAGFVRDVIGPRTVIVDDRSGVLRITFPADHRLKVLDRLLATGRLRADSTARWLEADDWSVPLPG